MGRFRSVIDLFSLFNKILKNKNFPHWHDSLSYHLSDCQIAHRVELINQSQTIISSIMRCSLQVRRNANVLCYTPVTQPLTEYAFSGCASKAIAGVRPDADLIRCTTRTVTDGCNKITISYYLSDLK